LITFGRFASPTAHTLLWHPILSCDTQQDYACLNTFPVQWIGLWLPQLH
jgi:hypothetical protein